MQMLGLFDLYNKIDLRICVAEFVEVEKGKCVLVVMKRMEGRRKR